MDITELHDEENLLVQMQDRWGQPRKPSKSNLWILLRSCGNMTIPLGCGNI